MQQWILIENSGQVELGAFTLLGATSKTDEPEKIGYFGTGVKYAIAYMLRNDIEFHVFSGEREIPFITQLQKFRGQIFNVVLVDGRATSITTAMGRDWTNWQALREVYCNALDEPEGDLEIVSHNPIGFPGMTRFYISTKGGMGQLVASDTFGKYFCRDAEVVFELPSVGQILKPFCRGAGVYRRGIKVYESDQDNSVYDYNLDDVRIGEDRLIKHPWEVWEGIWKLVAACTDPNVIKDIMDKVMTEGWLEAHAFSYWHDGGAVFNDAGWDDFLKDTILATPVMQPFLDEIEHARTTYVSDPLLKSLRKAFGSKVNLPSAMRGQEHHNYIPAKDVPAESRERLRQALLVLQEAGYIVTFPIDIVLFANENVLGAADPNAHRIKIGLAALNREIPDIMMTLVEENTHLRYRVTDCTRAMQDALLRQLVTIIGSFGSDNSPGEKDGIQ